ncbi:hypothetical protein [Sporomusa carbonis]|uniref:hypothetical protein n=1 Tax=Sporomusa carbonis TaxID=3076075 RepID=UPI003C7E8938
MSGFSYVKFYGGGILELNLSNTVQIITIISFSAALVKYLIVNPLQAAINSLKEAVAKIETILFRLEQDQKNIDKRLVAVEESTKSAHKRLDGIEGVKH